MSEKVKLKKEYVRLKQLGKEKEASEVLRKIWNFNKENSEEEIVVKPLKLEKLIPQEKIILTKKSKFKKIKDLSKLKGIGKETVKDINSLYSNLEDLIKDLKNNKRIPLRNDVSVKLKKEFI